MGVGTYFVFYLLLQESIGSPWRSGGRFSFGASANSTAEAGVQLRAHDGHITSDVTGEVSRDTHGNLRGSVYHEDGGHIIGLNGGVEGKAGGAAGGGIHAEAGLKDGKLVATANSTSATTSYSGLTGHANIATGDAARRELAEYGGKSSHFTATGHSGAKIDLVPVMSTVTNIIENFWLYFWLCFGCIVFIVSCCVATICLFYWKLINDVKGLKMEYQDRKQSVESAKPWKPDC